MDGAHDVLLTPINLVLGSEKHHSLVGSWHHPKQWIRKPSELSEGWDLFRDMKEAQADSNSHCFYYPNWSRTEGEAGQFFFSISPAKRSTGSLLPYPILEAFPKRKTLASWTSLFSTLLFAPRNVCN